VPVLVDFGGVCFGWRPATEGGSTIVGTYGYMPPEQLVGQVSPASDLYGLGATLLHVVTGRPPGDFPFDSGRIEVPADLPVRRALRDLLSALLEPAPRNRPASARAAREILLRAAEPVALAVRPAAGLAISTGGAASQLVNVGPPPRDPRGPLADVYSNLIDMIGLSRIHSRGLKALAVIGMIGLGLVTIGTLPLAYKAIALDRRKKYDPLFRTGLAVEGRIVSAHKKNDSAAFSYGYEVAGVPYRRAMTYPKGWLGLLVIGDSVTVLYDERDPARSCFVLR